MKMNEVVGLLEEIIDEVTAYGSFDCDSQCLKSVKIKLTDAIRAVELCDHYERRLDEQFDLIWELAEFLENVKDLSCNFPNIWRETLEYKERDATYFDILEELLKKAKGSRA